MRLGTVIGRVTLSATVPALDRRALAHRLALSRASTFSVARQTPADLSTDPDLVVYDDLGGGLGQTIGFVEGREAACPFDEPTPVDAINARPGGRDFLQPV